MVVAVQTAVIGDCGTGRSRGGRADGRYWHSQHKPESQCSYGRPLRAVEVQAEVVVVVQTAVICSSSTGRSRVGRTDGRYAHSRYRPKSWWVRGWRCGWLVPRRLKHPTAPAQCRRGG